ncbi:MAG: hypothetical protein ABJA34_00845 [Pseudonocardiales bacterium]
MNAQLDTADADRALKAKHRAMWTLGDYPAVARTVVAALGPVLVQACAVGRDDRVYRGRHPPGRRAARRGGRR